MPKRKQIVEGVIEHAVFPNKGILYLDKEPIFVTGTFKGQKVRARLHKRKKGNWEAQLLEVLETPAYFTEAACEYFGRCGGCTSQQLAYEDQIKLKHDQVKTLLDDAKITGYEDLGIIGSPENYG